MMITTSDTVTIGRPLPEVFSFVADVRNDPAWNPDMLEASLASGREPQIDVGSAFDVRFKPFMGASSCTMRVTALAPDERLVIEGAPGALKARAEFRFQAVSDGTRLTRETRVEMPGIMRLMEPLGRRRLKKQSAVMLQALKTVLESSPPS